ncbi:MAG: trypsin-like peptidase domain-containing protein [Planctomycetes bacterium]|nr:trypsin-like peptidase domain-containing protein [Planctomycetota bacterium]
MSRETFEMTRQTMSYEHQTKTYANENSGETQATHTFIGPQERSVTKKAPPRAGSPTSWFFALSWMFAFFVLGCLVETNYEVMDRLFGNIPDPQKIEGGTLTSDRQVLAVAAAAPSVVSISAKHVSRSRMTEIEELMSRFFGGYDTPAPAREVQQLGSGFIFDDEGHIVTNWHVVEGAEQIQITFASGEQSPAVVKGAVRTEDIAVLYCENAKKYPSRAWGDSDKLEVGEIVLAIGNPFGFSHSATSGIISAKKRRGIGTDPEADFLQTSAAINPGNSGGPLIDLDGNVIGVNAAIYSETGGNWGIGFAIPSNRAKEVVSRIISGEGQRNVPYFGIQYSTEGVTSETASFYDLKQTDGVEVTAVAADGPAASNGVRRRDIIVKVDDTPVNASNFATKIDEVGIGNKCKITLLRPSRTGLIEVIIDGLTISSILELE